LDSDTTASASWALIDLYTASPGEPEDGNLYARDALSKNFMDLKLADGTVYQGCGFGVSGKSISGECAFQTGMVIYPESLTDTSYKGPILVLTYPLIGSYGVPKNEDLVLPTQLKSFEIQVAALVVASYSGTGMTSVIISPKVHSMATRASNPSYLWG